MSCVQKVDVRLYMYMYMYMYIYIDMYIFFGKRNSKSHGARPVHRVSDVRRACVGGAVLACVRGGVLRVCVWGGVPSPP
jgi:hypothetical protein